MGRAHPPQRPQAEPVDGAHQRIPAAADQRGWALRQRAADGPVVAVERAGRAHRRKQHRQRLGKWDAAVDQGRHQQVEILGVAGARDRLRAQARQLQPQPADGVDLAVVGEPAERLHALERRQRVGGVAAVGDRHPGGEQRVREVGREPLQGAGIAERLVDAAEARQRGDMHARPLQLQPDPKQRAVDGGAQGRLPQRRRALAAARPQRRRVGLLFDQRQQLEAGRAQGRLGIVAGQVGDGELGRVRDRGAQPVGPQPTGDVDLHAAAVALAVDAAGPVRHPLERAQRVSQRPRRGAPVTGDHRRQRAGIVLRLIPSIRPQAGSESYESLLRNL